MFFKSIGLISFLLLGLCAALSDLELFNKFKIDYNKNYATKEEEESRFQIFQTNWHKVQEHNENYTAGKVSWSEGINKFTDLTDTEFKTKYLVPYTDEFSFRNLYITHEPRIHRVNLAHIPPTMDWRIHKIVTRVKDQRACGSCWAFSTIGAIEAAYAKSHPTKLETFSEQALVDCERITSKGCEIGNRYTAFAYAIEHGVVYEKSYPYKAVQAPTCEQKGFDFKISNFTFIDYNNEDALKHAVGTIGPVSVGMNFSIFRSYKQGIYQKRFCLNDGYWHAVLIVGYGKENGIDYWILKNSYGVNWGESGYLRVQMGHNICAIASFAYYPNLF